MPSITLLHLSAEWEALSCWTSSLSPPVPQPPQSQAPTLQTRSASCRGDQAQGQVLLDGGPEEVVLKWHVPPKI